LIWLLSWYSTFAQTVNFNWVKQSGISGNENYTSVTIDTLGYVYAAGEHNGAIYISKSDSLGNIKWSKQMGPANVNQANSIIVDLFGNVYTTGTFIGVADFDPGPAIYTLSATGQGNYEVFVSKLDSSGNFVWAKSIGGSSYDEGLNIKIDTISNVYITGYFSGTADFDPGISTYTLASSFSSKDIFVLKLDSSGNFIWAKQIGGIITDSGNCLTLDRAGNVYVVGSFQGTPDFDPGVGNYFLPTLGGYDAFILKLNNSGDFVWVKSIGGGLHEHAYSLGFDAFGNIYVSGSFLGRIDFDPGPGYYFLGNNNSISASNVFILKLDSAGKFRWAKVLGESNTYIEHKSLTVDKFGNVYISGSSIYSFDCDPGPGVSNLGKKGNQDVFILELNALGDFVWAKSIGGNKTSVWSENLVIDKSFNLYSVGHFYSSPGGFADFDPSPNVYTITPVSHDAYLLKLSVSGVRHVLDTAVVVTETLDVGLGHENLQNNFCIFPNPTSDVINIVLNDKHYKRIRLINYLGQVLEDYKEINSNTFLIDVSQQPSGIFFIELYWDENIINYKIIKN